MTHRCGYVALIGLPNVGKSSIMNRLVGEEVAIVTSLPQTTRQRITGIISNDATQMIFLDTPGIHDSAKQINQAMLAWVRRAAVDADGICVVVAADAPERGLELVREAAGKKLACVALNKIDLVTPEAQQAIAARVARWGESVRIVPVSAKTGEGIETLRRQLEALLPEGPALFPPDIYTEHPVRFLTAELIRRAAMQAVHQELPYAMAVEIDEFKEGETLTRIEASLIVERESQKGMVIGRGGKMIKQIGSAARPDIERLVGTQVFLELRVAVRPNWTKDPAQLQRFGIRPPRG